MAPQHRLFSRSHSRFWAGVGVVLLALAVVGTVYPLWWNHHSSSSGAALLQRTGQSSDCGSSAARGETIPTRRQPGVLKIPAIGLTAPVLDGLGNAVLNVAVGHDPTTVWPGHPGESLLLAHDVSYFSRLDRVRPGDLVTWALGCERVVFRVIRTEVTYPGATLTPPSSGSGLALITCWPTNALFWTPQRYVVTAELVAHHSLGYRATVRSPALLRLSVPAPAALVAQGLSAAKTGVLVGKLAITGSPSARFREGPEPLAIVAVALRAYVAAIKTAQAGNQSWWSALAVPGVALPSPWSLAYDTNVTIVVKANTVEGVVLSSTAATVTLAVHEGALVVTGVRTLR